MSDQPCDHGHDQPWPMAIREGAPVCMCCGWPLGTPRPFCDDCDSFATGKRFLDAILAQTNDRRPLSATGEDRQAMSDTMRQPAPTPGGDDAARPREVGELVREVWVAWSREQADVAEHPSWTVPWNQLSDRDREVDRRIEAAIRAESADALREVTEERDKLRTALGVVALVKTVATARLVARDALSSDPYRHAASRPVPAARSCSVCGGEWQEDAAVSPDGGYCGACEDAGRSYGTPAPAAADDEIPPLGEPDYSVLCVRCGQPSAIRDGQHHPPPGGAYHEQCNRCLDHRFVMPRVSGHPSVAEPRGAMGLTEVEFVSAWAERLAETPPPPALGTRSKCEVCKTSISYQQYGWTHDTPAMGEWSVTAHHAATPSTEEEGR